MASIPAPDGPDVNIGRPAITVMWVMSSISGLLLGLRLFTRAFLMRQVRSDDYMMILAWIAIILHSSFLTESHRWGFGRHFFYLNNEEKLNAMKWNFMSQPWGILSGMFGRVSFMILLLNFCGSNVKRKASLWFALGSQIFINLLTIILIFVQCGRHVTALWDGALQAKVHCWSPNVQTYFGFFQSSWNSVTDIYLTVLPAFILWELRISKSQKLSLYGFLSLSIFAFAVSVIKCIQIRELGAREDFTWNTVVFMIWVTVEDNVIIIGSTIPTLKPLISWKKIRNGSSNAMYGSTQMSKPSASHNQRTWARKSGVYANAIKLDSMDNVKDAGDEDNMVLRPMGIQKTMDISVSYKDVSTSGKTNERSGEGGP